MGRRRRTTKHWLAVRPIRRSRPGLRRREPVRADGAPNFAPSTACTSRCRTDAPRHAARPVPRISRLRPLGEAQRGGGKWCLIRENGGIPHPYCSTNVEGAAETRAGKPSWFDKGDAPMSTDAHLRPRSPGCRRARSPRSGGDSGSGPTSFVSGSDGYRDPADEQIKPELANEAVAQCRNAYGRVRQRLERAGYSGDWRGLDRELHQRTALAAGADGPVARVFSARKAMARQSASVPRRRLNGINMLTASVLAVGSGARTARQSSSSRPRGRACADHAGRRPDLRDRRPRPQESGDRGAFPRGMPRRVRGAGRQLQSGHWPPTWTRMGAAWTTSLRIDCALRGERFVAGAEAALRQPFDGRLPFALQAFGTILGGPDRTGDRRRRNRRPRAEPADPMGSGGRDAGGKHLGCRPGVPARHVRHEGRAGRSSPAPPGRGPQGPGAARFWRTSTVPWSGRAPTGPGCCGSTWFCATSMTRTAVIGHLAAELGGSMPVATVIGGEPRNGAELEVTAIAGGGA